jgi:hypothetical protein
VATTISCEGENDQDQPESGHDLREKMSSRSSVMHGDAHCGLGEHQVGHDSSSNAASYLSRNVGDRTAPRHSAECGIDERDNRVEVGS